jgi:hypothetical protein
MTPRERAELDNPFAQSTRMMAAGKRQTLSFLQKYFRVFGRLKGLSPGTAPSLRTLATR